MNNERDEFISEGLIRYKVAHNIYTRFQIEIHELLQSVLVNRSNYGQLIIQKNSIKLDSWSKKLVLNARIRASINDTHYFIGIGLDWVSGTKDLPIPIVWIENSDFKYIKLRNSYSWKNTLFDKNNQLAFINEFEYTNLDSIFNSLLDEIVEYMETEIKNN